MKKVLTISVFVVILLIGSGYIENSYCHSLVTQSPPGAIEKEYYPGGIFCEINSYLVLPAILFELFIDLIQIYIKF